MQVGYCIPGMLWPSEQGWLYDNLKRSKSHCEVGTYCGKSLFVTCAGFMLQCNVVSVDQGGDYTAIGGKWVADVLASTIDAIHANTRALVHRVMTNSIDAARANTQYFDSVFIDACHDYAECKADIEAWSNFVKPGGIVCGHDYWAKDTGVMDAVNETGEFNVASGTRIWWRRV
jgi:predicted O-methyltransferase YrrM